MPNLNSAIDLDYKKFFSWWLEELSFLIPEKLKALVSDQRGVLVVRPEGKFFQLSYWEDGREQNLEELSRDEAGATKYQEMLAKDERLQKADVILRLTKKYGIQKELSLPAAARENLYQVVAYELSRYSPFRVDQAYFAVRPLPIQNEPGQLRVVLVLTAREVLETFYAELRAFGMSPKFADYQGLPNNLRQREGHYNLLPEQLRQKPDQTAGLIHGGLMALVALLAFLALALPVMWESNAVDNLQDQIKSIEKEAKNIKGLQGEVDTLVDETRQLIAIKNERPPVVAVLDNLSKLIKDDTWLAYSQYAGGQLQIQGESPAASSLISVLEASDYFANAKFVSPVTRDNITKQERFQITVDVTQADANKANGTKQ